MIATVVTRHTPEVATHLANRGGWTPAVSVGRSLEGPGDGAQRKRVLVVDDEYLIADSITEILNRNGFDARACYEAHAVMQVLTQSTPDVLLMDVIMPRLSGVEVAKAVHAINPTIRMLLLSGNAAASRLLNDAIAEGFLFEVLAKPLHPLRLLKVLNA